MKKKFLILSLFAYSYANADCNSSVQTAKNYVDTYIVPNGQNAITGQRANAALNYIITALKCVDTISDLSFTKNSTRDSFVIVYKGVRFAVKDSIGSGGGGGSQTLSISNDTLTISNGNSVILPIYFQSDSATITSYDVLNSQNAPPISPNTGDTYLVGTSPSGAWVGHAKDIAEWNGSSWDFTDGVQGDFLYNATTALTYIFRSGNWVQTTGIPALNNGNTISSGLKIGTNNLKSLTFETNNIPISRFDSIGRFYVYDTSLRHSNKYLQIDSITGRLIASDISSIGGTSALFPNGIEIVNASRAFLSSDAGKILFLLQDVNITFDNVFVDLSTLGVFCIGNNTVEMENGSVVSAANGEFLHLIYGSDGFTPISSFKYDGKTALRYLYDQSQNAIPLSGTEIGKPVTGDIEFQTEVDSEDARKLYSTLSGIERRLLFDWESPELRIELFDVLNDLVLSKFRLMSSGISLSTDNSIVQSSLHINGVGVLYNSNEPTCVGYSSNQDFTANITDLDYTQKKYVDTHIAFTSVPTSSTDTGVKGQMAVDATYLYVCVATDTWTRVALIW